MTLCIAAACHERKKPRIVIGTDQRIETYMAGADIQSKLYSVGSGPNEVAVLIAGNFSNAMMLGDTYRQYIEQLEELNQKKPEIVPSSIMDIYQAPLTKYKSKLADQYTGRQFGMSYKSFLQAIANKQIPERIAENAIAEIRKIRLDCCLLVALFAEKSAFIFKIEEDGSLEICEHFASIGAGASIADGVLYQREHAYDTVTVNKAIYHVYEAMKLGSIAPGVSRDLINIAVIYPPGELRDEKYGQVYRTLSEEGHEIMERQFKRVGPRKLTRAPALTEGSLDEGAHF